MGVATLSKRSFPSRYSQHHNSQTFSARELEIFREYPPHTICHVSCVTCHLSPVTGHLSRVTCDVSPVMCHLSLVTCHMYFCSIKKVVGKEKNWRKETNFFKSKNILPKVVELIGGGSVSTEPTPSIQYLYIFHKAIRTNRETNKTDWQLDF